MGQSVQCHFDSALSRTRRSDAADKENRIACTLLDVFACGQVSSPRLYRLRLKTKRVKTVDKKNHNANFLSFSGMIFEKDIMT